MESAQVPVGNMFDVTEGPVKAVRSNALQYAVSRGKQLELLCSLPIEDVNCHNQYWPYRVNKS